MTRKALCGSTADEIYLEIVSSGHRYAHAVAIANNIYKKKVHDIFLIHGIPGKLREKLSRIYFTGIFKPATSEISADKTVKYLFRNEAGLSYETVFIPDRKRNTVCVSTQSGCRMGCPFCLTGQYGFHGNLSAGEIISQIIGIPEAGIVNHVVFMGMGEPLDNLENTLKACQIITSEWGLAISPRNVTVSTVGITPSIVKYLQDCDCNFTLSLFSPFAEERIKAVPVEKKYPVNEIIELLKNYPVKKKRRVSIAYIMIKDVNDTDRHLEGLKVLIRGLKIRINLLPYHPGANDVNISSTDVRMHYFKHNLIISGIPASIRASRGVDISAACGLLASGLKNKF
jgi:23S rRNA (adenine2503-C2)-methyltransferase